MRSFSASVLAALVLTAEVLGMFVVSFLIFLVFSCIVGEGRFCFSVSVFRLVAVCDWGKSLDEALATLFLTCAAWV